MKYQNKNPLKIAFAGEWRSIHPGLQHTVWGDLVLSNQFDSLVAYNDSGVLSPLAAKSWKISDDFKEFEFEIDTTLRFSDGSYLEAKDFKNSWEDALKLAPMSANSSLQDVLYKIDGYNRFKETGTISGIVASDKNKLIIKFSSPNRMALAHLAGNRFSAFKKNNDGFIGTSRYLIREIAPTKLKLDINSFHSSADALDELNLEVVPANELLQALDSNKIDVWAYGIGLVLEDAILKSPKYKVIPGQEAVHVGLELNTNNNIFSDRKMRLAFQSLIAKALYSDKMMIGPKEFFSVDLQSYLPVQAGRLDEAEVEKLVSFGNGDIETFLKRCKDKPLKFYFGANTQSVFTKLKNIGVEFDDSSSEVSMSEVMDLHYGKSNLNYDILSFSFSLASGDPDGIYHAFGKNGAILNPAVYSEKVGDLLEAGRNLINIDDLDDHYKKVSRALLEEARFIHFGFARAIAVIRKDRVDVDDLSLRRNEGHLHVFKAK